MSFSKSEAAEAVVILALAIRSHGRELERSLQIVTGTAFLTVLATLSSTWLDLLSPIGLLRMAYITALTNLAGGFAFVFLATVIRILFSAEPQTSNMTSWSKPSWALFNHTSFLFGWTIFMGMSVFHVYEFGSKLLVDLTTANTHEISQAEAGVDNLRNRLDVLEKQMDELSKGPTGRLREKWR